MVTFGKVIRSVAVVVALSGTGAFGASNITQTKHNLSYTGPGSITASAGQSNDELCVYCHTPHAANTAFTGAPLWNKKTPSGTFTLYGVGGKTMAGTTSVQPLSPSLACLSCHDGASAINSMINMPGSGGWVATTGTNADFNTTTGGAAFTMPTSSVANLGTDLSNDHPVSIVYTAGKASLRATSDALTGTWAGGYTTVNQLLRAGNVECGSCHDPHEGDNKTFLRTANAGSALCLGCHAK